MLKEMQYRNSSKVDTKHLEELEKNQNNYFDGALFLDERSKSIMNFVV